ncbi:MAG: hypothetical protein ACK5R7_05745 [Armatimonadota bacterium]
MISLEQRLARLERQNRVLTGLVVALVMGVASVAMIGAGDGPKDIEVRTLSIRNDDGQLVGYMGACDKGSELVLFNKKSYSGLHLEATEDGGIITLNHPNENPALTLSANEATGKISAASPEKVSRGNWP